MVLKCKLRLGQILGTLDLLLDCARTFFYRRHFRIRGESNIKPNYDITAQIIEDFEMIGRGLLKNIAPCS